MVPGGPDWYRRPVPYGTVRRDRSYGRWVSSDGDCHHRARSMVRRGVDSPWAGESYPMIGDPAASRRFQRLRNSLIALQITLLLFSMAAPIGTLAADPPPAESPAPSADPT